jgi:hypothetical protein
MKATVTISSVTGSQLLTVQVNDYDPFVVLTVRATTVQLTRDECRQVADALGAAALREPFDSAPHQ